MATSTASGYGTYAPAAIDPFPIESVLAKIVGENNPAEAANMLDTYQIQNQTSQGNYNYAMGQQHDFAKQALSQQLYEANLKGLAEAKDPAVLQLMAGNPTYSGVLGDNRANIGDVLQRARAAQDATTFQHGAAGLQSATTAGFQPSSDQAARATMGLAGPQGTPEALQVANIHAAATRSAASTGEPMSAQVGPNEATGNVPLTVRSKKGETGEQFVTRLQQSGYTPQKVQLPGDTGTATSSSAAPTPNRVPNLPMAKTDTPANAPTSTRVQAASPGADPVQKAVADHVENVVRVQNPAAYKDIMAGAAKNGNQIQLLKDPKGNIIGVKGAQGTYR